MSLLEWVLISQRSKSLTRSTSGCVTCLDTQLELISEPFHLGVVWEFIARTKTASSHLYRGLRSYGPGISLIPGLVFPSARVIRTTRPGISTDLGAVRPGVIGTRISSYPNRQA